MKKRIDVLLYEKGLAPSREKARTLIMAGCVYADNQKFDKPGDTVREDAVLEVRGNTLRYVSRGGLKLEKAMQLFPIKLENTVCMDIGASTGGFTDCMLKRRLRSIQRRRRLRAARLAAAHRPARGESGAYERPLSHTRANSGGD